MRASTLPRMTATPWWDYVQRHMSARGWAPADLSRASGIDQSVIGRWRDKGATPKPDNVRNVAHALARDVLEAAIAAGHYTADELARGVRPTGLDLSDVSHEDLRDEVYARMSRSTARPRRRRPAVNPVPGGGAGASGSPDNHDIADVPAVDDQDVTTVHRGRLGESADHETLNQP